MLESLLEAGHSPPVSLCYFLLFQPHQSAVILLLLSHPQMHLLSNILLMQFYCAQSFPPSTGLVQTPISTIAVIPTAISQIRTGSLPYVELVHHSILFLQNDVVSFHFQTVLGKLAKTTLKSSVLDSHLFDLNLTRRDICNFNRVQFVFLGLKLDISIYYDPLFPKGLQLKPQSIPYINYLLQLLKQFHSFLNFLSVLADQRNQDRFLLFYMGDFIDALYLFEISLHQPLKKL